DARSHADEYDVVQSFRRAEPLFTQNISRTVTIDRHRPRQLPSHLGPQWYAIFAPQIRRPGISRFGVVDSWNDDAGALGALAAQGARNGGNLCHSIRSVHGKFPLVQNVPLFVDKRGCDFCTSDVNADRVHDNPSSQCCIISSHHLECQTYMKLHKSLCMLYALPLV